MCGITAFLIHSKETEDITDSPDVDEKYYKEEILKSSKSIRHRGPDWSGNEICKSDVNINTVYMAHERLSIIGVLNGSQPIVHHFIKNGKQYKIVLCVNGEIYTYKHDSFWMPMDTLRDKIKLNEMCDNKTAPWVVWSN